jgi:hypothetical protein
MCHLSRLARPAALAEMPAFKQAVEVVAFNVVPIERVHVAGLRGRLHVYESVYESPYDSVHDLLPKGLGF